MHSLITTNGIHHLHNSQRHLLLDHGLHSVVHVLDEGDLGEAEAPLVRDVVDVVRGF